MVWPFQRLLSVLSTRLNFLAVARIFGDNWAFRSARARSIESILVKWRIFEGKEAILKNAAFSRLRHYVRLSSMLKKLKLGKPARHNLKFNSNFKRKRIISHTSPTYDVDWF